MSATKPLHILFVSSWFPHRKDPYPGDFVQRHAQAVSLLNKVTVLHVRGEQGLKKVEVETNSIDSNYTETIVYFPKSKWKWMNALKKAWFYHKFANKIASYDVIHANVMYYDLFWVLGQSFFSKTPFVISEHWTGYYQTMHSFRKWFCRKLAQRASYVLPVSKQLQLAMEQQGIKANYEMVPNVVDTQKFVPIEDQNASKTVFLHISTLREQHKNIQGQLNVVKNLVAKGYDFEYHIGGNGDLQPILDFVKKHELQNVIKPFGALTHEEVVYKMQEANAFVLFSNYENLPCVILESFAVGVPVISTHVGGISEFFPNDFGILIEKGNEKDLENAMLEIIQNKSFADKREMHSYAERNFSKSAIAQNLDKIYRDILNKNTPQ